MLSVIWRRSCERFSGDLVGSIFRVKLGVFLAKSQESSFWTHGFHSIKSELSCYTSDIFSDLRTGQRALGLAQVVGIPRIRSSSRTLAHICP